MRTICLILLLLTALGQSHAQSVQHPLDPMSWQEFWTVLEVLRDADHLDASTRFSMVNLEEPEKELVWTWSPGQDYARTAYALVRQGVRTFEARIDLLSHNMLSWNEVIDAQPNWLSEEYASMTDLVKDDPEFREAMARRGYDDLTFVDCWAGPPGYFGTEEQRDRRVAHVSCEDVSGVRNTWARQIEGVMAVVDMNTRKILRVVDEDVVSTPAVLADYDPGSIGETRDVPGPMEVSQPLGHGFDLDGYVVSWQNWRFHARPDHRVGMIVSTVTYDDQGDRRQVLYRGSLSEIFVPYMDPASGWYWRNFLDSGEYTDGGLAKPLLHGLDCPEYAVYMPQLVAEDNGRPKQVPNAVCIFERQTGDMSWRHWTDDGAPESRVARELVVRSAAVLGNYDYVFDWIFKQNGSIRIAVGATGIAEAKAVNETATSAPLGLTADGSPSPLDRPDGYGRFVDPQIVAVNHDHYFSFRLDLDVDGPKNSLLVDRLRTRMLPEGHPRRSVWVSEPMVARTEAEAKLNINLSRPALWRIISSDRTNHVGYRTSYQIAASKNTNTLLSEDDYPRQRAGFIDHHLWVTPYDAKELYAAGDFPTLSKPGEGLPDWTAENREIADTDIVAWHTIGMHHMVRGEDWPVMPVLWHSFELRPFDFFDHNPAMDIPR